MQSGDVLEMTSDLLSLDGVKQLIDAGIAGLDGPRLESVVSVAGE